MYLLFCTDFYIFRNFVFFVFLVVRYRRSVISKIKQLDTNTRDFGYRVFGTWKWPITSGSEYYMQLIVRTLNMNYDRKEVPVKPFCIMQTFPNDISWFTT